MVAATGFAEWRGPDSGRIFARVQFFDGACDNDPDSDSNPWCESATCSGRADDAGFGDGVGYGGWSDCCGVCGVEL